MVRPAVIIGGLGEDWLSRQRLRTVLPFKRPKLEARIKIAIFLDCFAAGQSFAASFAFLLELAIEFFATVVLGFPFLKGAT